MRESKPCKALTRYDLCLNATLFVHPEMFKKSLLALLLSAATSTFAMPINSQHAVVVDEASGAVLLEKNPHEVVPIASLTKLMTAMVVLDAKPDMNEPITIEDSDVDTLKFSSSRVPVGTVLPRSAVLELALMSSDNRAAAALGRTYPGGLPAFVRAVREKLAALDMRHTTILEPTGLSPYNRSTAADLVKMVSAASRYPEITHLTTGAEDLIDMNGRLTHYHNTNRLVGREGWDILLSKTGFTREAGRCLVMRFQAAGKNVIMVLLNAKESASRMMDAENVQRLVTGQPMLAARTVKAPMHAVAHKAKGAKGGIVLAKAKNEKGKKKRKTV